jgi:hypothetical protein
VAPDKERAATAMWSMVVSEGQEVDGITSGVEEVGAEEGMELMERKYEMEGEEKRDVRPRTEKRF